MNRHPYSLRPVAAAVMYNHPHFGRNSQQGWSGYSDKPSDSESEFVCGDSHFRAVRDVNSGYRPNYNAVPPPHYITGQQFNGPQPDPPNSRQFPGSDPCGHHRQVGPAFGGNYQFRQRQTQQQFRPRAYKPSDYRAWEYATSVPRPHCERFKVLSYNILADYLATDHRQELYYHIPPHVLDWTWRRRSISFELGLWSADILCFQEVDRFHDIEAELKHRGYSGIWKMRTGYPIDGCATFWHLSRFKLLHEESIEYNKLGLRDNVAQICVFEFLEQSNTNGVASFSESAAKRNRVVVCNIHVLFNPKRGDIKLGQVRVLLDRAHNVSKLWDDAPLVICGDFNCTPKSPLYNFITERKLDLSELPRDKISGQASAEIRPPRPAYPAFRTQCSDLATLNKSPTDTQDRRASLSPTVSGEIVSLEPSCKDCHSKATDLQECVESNIEAIPNASVTFFSAASQLDGSSNSPSPDALDVSSLNSPVITSSVSAAVDKHRTTLCLGSSSLDSKGAGVMLDEKFDSLSLHEIKDEGHENSDSFLSKLHSTPQSPSLSDLISSSQNDNEKPHYNPSAWTPMEIQTATGSADCRVVEHPLKLTSSYAEVENSSVLRDSSGEPLATSYHRRFLGTVDYIWHSEGLQTTKVLAPIPKHVMQHTQGFPTKKWGSDHIALVSELAFTKDTSPENVSR